MNNDENGGHLCFTSGLTGGLHMLYGVGYRCMHGSVWGAYIGKMGGDFIAVTQWRLKHFTAISGLFLIQHLV